MRTSELGKFEGWRPLPQSSLQDSPPTPLSEGGAKRWIDPEILKKVIIDEAGNAYRVIPMELEFLRKYGLPLPRKHRLERLKGHFKVK